MMDIYKKYQAVAADKTIEGQTKKGVFERMMEQTEQKQIKDILAFANSNKKRGDSGLLLRAVLLFADL